MKKMFVIFVGCLCMMSLTSWATDYTLNDEQMNKISDMDSVEYSVEGVTFKRDKSKKDKLTEVVVSGSSPGREFKEALCKADIKISGKNLNCTDYSITDVSSSSSGVSDKASELLNKARAGKSVDVAYLCQNKLGNIGKNNNVDDCEYISPVFGICDTHAYNLGLTQNVSGQTGQVRDRVALKTTVISQQMYKQYEYLAATIRRIKTQLEKAVTTAQLEAAGAKSGGSSSNVGKLAGGANQQNTDKTLFLQAANNCSMKSDFDDFVNCETNNINLINTYADSADRKDACKQLQSDVKAIESRINTEAFDGFNVNWKACKNYVLTGTDSPKSCKDAIKENIKSCAVEALQNLSTAKRKRKQEENKYLNPWAAR